MKSSKPDQPTLAEHILESHSPRALNSYLRTIEQYTHYLGEAVARKATYPQVVDYLGVLRERPMHPKTIRNHLYAIKMYYQWLVDTGQRRDHPCRDLFLKDKINRAIPVETLYSKAELDELLDTHRASLPLTRGRDKIILSLLVCQAVTVFEIIHLKITDVDLKKAKLRLAGSPKTMRRVLPLKPEQIMLFNDYLQRIRPLLWKNNHRPREQDYDTLILSVRGRQMNPNSISSMFKAPLSHGEKISPQKIRQSVIAHLLKSGQDLRVIQAFTGHKRVSSVEEYRQTGLEELKAAIDKYHPLG